MLDRFHGERLPRNFDHLSTVGAANFSLSLSLSCYLHDSSFYHPRLDSIASANSLPRLKINQVSGTIESGNYSPAKIPGMFAQQSRSCPTSARPESLAGYIGWLIKFSSARPGIRMGRSIEFFFFFLSRQIHPRGRSTRDFAVVHVARDDEGGKFAYQYGCSSNFPA